MFQFSTFASRICRTISLQLIRFPHSEICGSIHICWSPQLIAAYHVLLRLWEPRHPPCTLSYFLLPITPFARNGMPLFGRSLNHCVIGSFLPLLLMTEWLSDWMTSTTSLLLSSLSIYFFQYVKERFACSSLSHLVIVSFGFTLMT